MLNKKNGLSAVVLTKNEEKNIVDCLESLSFADEIIIINDNSTDRTLEAIKLVSNKKIIVYEHELNGDFSAQRNFAMTKANNDWILFVDADERISSVLAKEIAYKMVEGQNGIKGFLIKREDYFFGKKMCYGELMNKKFLRLADRRVSKWEGKIHEEWKVQGQVETLKSPILHYSHESINEYLKKLNFYTDLRARELFEQGKKAGVFSIIFYTFGKFFYNYIFKLGFLDGVRGLIVSVFMSMHSFLVRAKLWRTQ